MPSLTTYKLLKQEHDARRGEFKTVHGTVQTPAFQNAMKSTVAIILRRVAAVRLHFRWLYYI